MNNRIDNQVVKMTFDNDKFEKNAATTLKTVDKLKVSLNFTGVQKGLSEMSKMLTALPNTIASSVNNSFNASWSAADQFVRRITNSIITNTKMAADSVNVFKGAIKTGFGEYETQINAVQTIWANTKDAGTTMEDIVSVLDELNEYADKTIYNFTEMTRNIGTFTAAGIGLDESSKAIQGIANLAAISGSTSAQASNAMYQLSQALAAGRVTLADWNSVVNASMGGKVFQNVLIETAKEMGTISDELARGLENGTQTFRNTLTEYGWITSDVLTAALTKFTDVETELGRTATDAATKVKTFTQLIDTIKESVQSGWTQSWEYIIGDFGTARDLFTTISNEISGLLQPSMDARNEMLKYWSEGAEWDKQVTDTLKQTEEHQKEIEDLARRANVGEFGNGDERFKAIEEMGYDYREVQNAVNHLRGLGDAFKIEANEADNAIDANTKVNKTLDEMTGREATIYGLKTIYENIRKIFTFVKSGFDEVFPKLKGWELTELSKKFAEFAESTRPSVNVLIAIRSIVMTVLRVFKIAGKLISSVIRGIGNAFEGNFDDDILDWIFESELSFREFAEELEKGGTFDKVANKSKEIAESIGKAATYIADAIDGLAVKPIKDNLIDFYNNFNKADISEFFSDFWDWVNDGLLKPKKEPKESKIKTFLNDFKAFLQNTSNEINSFGEELAISIENVSNMLWGFIKSITIEDINTVLRGVMSVQIIQFMNDIGSVGRGLGGMFDGISEFFKSLTGTMNMLKKQGKSFLKAQTFKAMAAAMLMLVGSLTVLLIDIYAFSKLWNKDPRTVNTAVIAVGGLFAALVYATKKLADMEQVKTSVIVSMVTLMASLNNLIGLVLIFAVVPTDMLHKGFTVLAIFSALMIVLMYAMSALGMITKRAKVVESAGKTLLRFAVALNLMILPILALSLMTMEGSKLNIKQALGILGGVATVLVALVVIMTKLTNNSELKVSARTFLSLALAINLLTIPIAALSIISKIIDMDTLIASTAIIAALVGTLGIVVGLMTALTASHDLAVSTGALLGIALAINLLTLPVIALTMLAEETDLGYVAAAAGLLAGLMVVFAGVIFALSKTPKTDVIVSALAFAAFAGSLYIIGLAIEKMGQLEFKNLVAAGVVLGGLTVIFGALVGLLTAFSGKLDVVAITAGFIGYAAALLIIAKAFEVIAEIPIANMWNFVGVIAALVVLFGVFVGVLTALNTASGGAIILIMGLMGVALIAVAAIAEAVSHIIDSIANLINAVTNFAAFISGEDVTIANNTGNAIASGFETATAAGGKADLAAVAAGERSISSFVQGMNNGKDGMIDAATMAGVATGENQISSIVQGLQNNEMDLYSQSEQTGVNAINSVASGMEIQGPQLINGAGNIGKDTISNMASSMENEAYTNLYPTVENISGNMLGVLNGGLAINSPSEETKETGKWFDWGLMEGVKENLSKPLDAVKDAGEGMLDTLKETVTNSEIANTIKDSMSGTDLNNVLNLDELTEGLNGANLEDFGFETTLTPVLDMSNVTSGMGDLNSMLGTSSVNLSDLNGSLNSSLSVGDIQNGSYDDSLVVNSIRNLDSRLNALASAISGIQIRLDTGVLVGAMAGPMDDALGKRAVYSGRGI